MSEPAYSPADNVTPVPAKRAMEPCDTARVVENRDDVMATSTWREVIPSSSIDTVRTKATNYALDKFIEGVVMQLGWRLKLGVLGRILNNKNIIILLLLFTVYGKAVHVLYTDNKTCHVMNSVGIFVRKSVILVASSLLFESSLVW